MELDNTRLTKEEIIERLIKYYWDKMIRLVIPLNSTYQYQLNELQSVIKEGVSEYVPIDDGPLSLIVYKLPINTIFRLYQYSSQVRKLVDTRYGLFWKKLIGRDLGVVPQFKVNFKLYYLRMMNVPIAGSHYVSNKKHPGTFTKTHNDVVSMYKHIVVTASGKVYDYKKLHRHDILEVGERILDIGERKESVIICTNLGIKIYGGTTDHSEFGNLKITRIGKSWYEYQSVVTTYSGEAYVIDYAVIFKLSVPEPIISAEFIDKSTIVLLSVTGKLYSATRNASTRNASMRTAVLFADNVQYITDLGSYWINLDNSIYQSLLSYQEYGQGPPLVKNKIVVGVYDDRYIDEDLKVQRIHDTENEEIDIGFTDVLQYEGKYGVRLLPQIGS